MTTNWCCENFERLLTRVGQKGFAIIAFRDGDFRHFCLRASPFDAHVVDEFSQIDPSTEKVKWPELLDSSGIPVPYVSSLDFPLAHCPCCGAALAPVITQNTKVFDELAERV